MLVFFTFFCEKRQTSTWKRNRGREQSPREERRRTTAKDMGKNHQAPEMPTRLKNGVSLGEKIVQASVDRKKTSWLDNLVGQPQLQKKYESDGRRRRPI